MKNQRKVIAGIAAAFALLGSAIGLSNLLPSTAKAQVQPAVVTCVPYQQVGTWPVTYIKLCGVPDGQTVGGYVNTALIGINGTSGQSALASAMIARQQSNQYLGQFYVFPSSTEFLAWAPGKIPSGLIPTAADLDGVAGTTRHLIGANNTVIPQYTVIFETVKYLDGRPNVNWDVGSNLGNVAAHESGHWIDALLPLGTSVQTLKYLSNTQFFRNVYDADAAAIDKLVACGQFAQGLFNTNKQSKLFYTNPEFICNDSSPGANDGRGAGLIAAYAGLSNSTVLEFIFPEYFLKPPSNQFRDYSERLVQLYALTVLSDSDNNLLASASYRYAAFNNQFYGSTYLFPCTHKFIDIAYRYGRFPTAAEMGSTCPHS